MYNCCLSLSHRHKIRELDRVSTHQTLNLLRAFIRRRHYTILVDKLRLITIVQQTQPNIQSLLAASDFVGALELISTTQEVLTQELQGVHALRHLGSQLREMEKAIGRMMEGDFVSFCLEDIRQRIREAADGVEGLDTEVREGTGRSPTCIALTGYVCRKNYTCV